MILIITKYLDLLTKNFYRFLVWKLQSPHGIHIQVDTTKNNAIKCSYLSCFQVLYPKSSYTNKN